MLLHLDLPSKHVIHSCTEKSAANGISNCIRALDSDSRMSGLCESGRRHRHASEVKLFIHDITEEA